MTAKIPSFTPVDFAEIVDEMQNNKAFDDYANPLGTTDASKFSKFDSSFHNPQFPGDLCYDINGPLLIWQNGANLPHDLISAQRNSTKDAIRLYMPEKKMGEWMHEYFSGDFMASGVFRHLMKTLDFPKIWAFKDLTNELDSSLSMKLDDPLRKRNDRKMFTKMETKLTAKICKEVPALAFTVIAYQASYIEYLNKLGEAIDASSLSDKHKERGSVIIKNLADQWSNGNFVDNILPAVAINYYKNHSGNIGEKPNEKDFTMGMQFAVNNGVFKKEATPTDGKPRQFTCPAKAILTRISAVSMGHEASGAVEHLVEAKNQAAPSGSKVGIGLFHIYREVEKTLEKGSFATTEAVGDLNRMIDKALVEKK